MTRNVLVSRVTEQEKIRLTLALIELKHQGVISNVWVDAGRVKVQRSKLKGQITAMNWDRVKELVDELRELRMAQCLRKNTQNRVE